MSTRTVVVSCGTARNRVPTGRVANASCRQRAGVRRRRPPLLIHRWRHPREEPPGRDRPPRPGVPATTTRVRDRTRSA